MRSLVLLITASRILRTISKCPNPVSQFGNTTSPYVDEMDITSVQSAVITSETRMYHICFSGGSHDCYEPKLTIDFDTMPLQNNDTVDAYYSFYIWQENVVGNDTYLPMITNYSHTEECDLDVVKRIIKTSYTENEWRVIDTQYNDLLESRPLDDKTQEFGIVIIVDPKISLNATVTIDCSDSFDWSFDFEDDQTLVTFSVALIIFCLLWSISICCIRYDELKEQYTKSESKIDVNMSRCESNWALCMFGCGSNTRGRCYLFTSYSDDNQDCEEPCDNNANTWVHYVGVALILPVYVLLMLSYGSDFDGCYFQSLTLVTISLITPAFLMDLSLCQARWFGKCECSDGTCHCGNFVHKPMNDHEKCISNSIVVRDTFRRHCPCISYAYVVVALIVAVLCAGYVCSSEPFWRQTYGGMIVVFTTIPFVLLSLGSIPVALFWLFYVISPIPV